MPNISTLRRIALQVSWVLALVYFFLNAACLGQATEAGNYTPERLLVPSGIATHDGSIGFFPVVPSGIIAVRLSDGKELWNTKEPYTAIGVIGKSLVAVGEAKMSVALPKSEPELDRIHPANYKIQIWHPAYYQIHVFNEHGIETLTSKILPPGPFYTGPKEVCDAGKNLLVCLWSPGLCNTVTPKLSVLMEKSTGRVKPIETPPIKFPSSDVLVAGMPSQVNRKLLGKNLIFLKTIRIDRGRAFPGCGYERHVIELIDAASGKTLWQHELQGREFVPLKSAQLHR